MTYATGTYAETPYAAQQDPAAPQAYKDAVLADAPLAYWRLGETSGTAMLDSSGNSRAGTYAGSPTLGVNGLVPSDTDPAVALNGSSQYGQVTDAAWLNPTSLTLEALINPATIKQQGIIERDNGSSGRQYQFRMESTGKLTLILWPQGKAYTAITGNTVMAAGSTYHVAATYDGTTILLYINGALEATATTAGGSLQSVTSPLWIGSYSGGVTGSADFFSGKMDEVAIYGTALSGTRIKAHYDSSVATPATSTSKTLLQEQTADNALAIWRMDETGPAVGGVSLSFPSHATGGAGGAMTRSGGSVGWGKTGPFTGAKGCRKLDGSGRLASSLAGAYQVVTYEAWVKCDRDQNMTGLVLSSRGGSTGFSLGIGNQPVQATSAGSIWLGLDGGGVYNGAYAELGINDGNWHHVVGIWNGAGAGFNPNQLSLFVDGVQKTLTPYSYSGSNSTLGSSTDVFYTDMGGVGGTVSRPAVYVGKVLTLAQVQAHYAARTSVADYDAAVLTDAPSGYWTLDESQPASSWLADYTAHGRDAAWTASATTGQPSLDTSDPNGKSVQVGGSSGYAQFQAHETWMYQQRFTVEAIVQAASANGVIMARYGSNKADWDLQIDGSMMPTFGVMNNGSWTWITGTTALVAGQKYHLMATYDGAYATLYVNGSSIGSKPCAHAGYNESGVTLNIGALQDNWNTGVNTTGLDSLAYYGTGLTASRAAVHYAAATTPPTTPPTNAAVGTALGASTAQALNGMQGPVIIPMNNVIAATAEGAGPLTKYTSLTKPIGAAASQADAQRITPLKAPDPFGMPWVIAGDSGVLLHDMSDHGLESGEPNPNSATRTSWFQWTAPDTSLLARFHTRGSNVDTSLAVFTGSALNALALVAASDNAYGDAADITFAPTPGSTYMIQVGAKADPATAVELTWLDATPAEYDAFATPLDLEADRGYEGFTTTNGTIEAGESVPAGTVATSWLRWTASGTEPITFTIRSTDPDEFTVRAYNAGGGTLGSLMSVASATGTGEVAVTFAPAAGETYYLQVATGNDLRDFEIGWGTEAAPVDPEELPEPPAPEYEPVDVGPVLPRVYLRVEVYGPGGQTLISEVKRRTGVQWQEPLNTPGSGQITMHLDDELLEAYPDLLDFGNIVKFWMGTHCVHGFIIRNRKVNWVDSGEWAGRTITVSGPSVHYLLEDFIVRHDGDPRPDSLNTRYYSWASKPGEWLNMADWDHPVQQASMDNPPSNKKKKKPKNWKVPSAKWVWFTGGHGWRYMRKTFRIQDDGLLVRIFATADEWWKLYLDGEEIMSDDAFEIGYTRFKKYDTVLSRGQHTFAAQIRGLDTAKGGDGNDSFLFAMCEVDLDGKIKKPAILTSDNTWNAHAGNPAPGWNRAQVLRNVINEAKDRKIRSAMRLTIDFTGDTDSRGKKWPKVVFNQEVSIGTSGLNLQAQLSEGNGFDVWVDPEDMTVKAWIRRGVDKSASITLEPGRNLLNWEVSESDEVKNKYYIQYDGGWVEHNAAGSQEDFDERELYVSLGSVKSDQAAKELIKRASMGIARAQQRAGTGVIHRRPMGAPDGGLVGVPGAYPFIDYKTGDTVKGPNSRGKMVPMRVLSLSGAEDEDGNLSFDPDLEEIKSV